MRVNEATAMVIPSACLKPVIKPPGALGRSINVPCVAASSRSPPRIRRLRRVARTQSRRWSRRLRRHSSVAGGSTTPQYRTAARDCRSPRARLRSLRRRELRRQLPESHLCSKDVMTSVALILNAGICLGKLEAPPGFEPGGGGCAACYSPTGPERICGFPRCFARLTFTKTYQGIPVLPRQGKTKGKTFSYPFRRYERRALVSVWGLESADAATTTEWAQDIGP